MKRSRILLLILAITFLVVGAADAFISRPAEIYTVLDWFHMLAVAVLCAMWCGADAKEREIDLPPRTRVWAAVFPPIGVSVYLFRTRTRREALMGVGKSVLFLLFSLVLSGVGAFVGEYFAPVSVTTHS